MGTLLVLERPFVVEEFYFFCSHFFHFVPFVFLLSKEEEKELCPSPGKARVEFAEGKICCMRTSVSEKIEDQIYSILLTDKEWACSDFSDYSEYAYCKKVKTLDEKVEYRLYLILDKKKKHQEKSELQEIFSGNPEKIDSLLKNNGTSYLVKRDHTMETWKQFWYQEKYTAYME